MSSVPLPKNVGFQQLHPTPPHEQHINLTVTSSLIVWQQRYSYTLFFLFLISNFPSFLEIGLPATASRLNLRTLRTTALLGSCVSLGRPRVRPLSNGTARSLQESSTCNGRNQQKSSIFAHTDKASIKKPSLPQQPVCTHFVPFYQPFTANNAVIVLNFCCNLHHSYSTFALSPV